ncbi:3-hydroxyacyl-ACP dehydratase FabZ [bacterium]|nr:3-hydroxyacyl-ACP dehydratase FabZ [bacterium]
MLETSDLLQILPHRIPALYLDRVTEVFPGGAVGYKNVTATEPQFRGHFVDNPVMPGVLTLEALIQLIWVAYRCQGLNEAALPEGWQVPEAQIELNDIERIRFRQMVRPGDRLDLRVEEREASGDSRLVSAVAQVDGKVACEAMLRVTVS